MNSSTIATAIPDETDRARQLIELGMALDPEARSETVARLIAASLHGGPDTALAAFAATGVLDHQQALHELNDLRVPIEHEAWIDALGCYILVAIGGQS